MKLPLYIVASGMVNSVGFSSAAVCAAIRCSLQNVTETYFKDQKHEPVLGAQVSFEEPLRGVARLVEMAAPAIWECVAVLGKISPSQVPLLLGIAEEGRPGRLDGLAEELWPALERKLGFKFHPKSTLLPFGRVSVARGFELASELMQTDKVPRCIVAGVDSFLHASTISVFENRQRLLTTENSNGFIPGEGAAAVLVSPTPGAAEQVDLQCAGFGSSVEKATADSEEPLRADGLTSAFNTAMAEAGCTMTDVGYRICDANGEQYHFKEASLALIRATQQKRGELDIWHPADCIGEVGAAIGPTILGVSLVAARKKYAPGPVVLAHFGSDDGTRAAMILKPSAGDKN